MSCELRFKPSEADYRARTCLAVMAGSWEGGGAPLLVTLAGLESHWDSV